eukprot:Gb_29713 [translate_table: standard]
MPRKSISSFIFVCLENYNNKKSSSIIEKWKCYCLWRGRKPIAWYTFLRVMSAIEAAFAAPSARILSRCNESDIISSYRAWMGSKCAITASASRGLNWPQFISLHSSITSSLVFPVTNWYIERRLLHSGLSGLSNSRPEKESVLQRLTLLAIIS